MLRISCLTADCKRIGIRRGLCMQHYNQLATAVAAGEITWAKAEAAGSCHARGDKKGWAVPFKRKANVEKN